MMDDDGRSMGNGIVLHVMHYEDWYKVWCFKQQRWYRMRGCWLELILPCLK